MLKLLLPRRLSSNHYRLMKNSSHKLLQLYSQCSTHASYLSYEDQIGGLLDIMDGLEYHHKKISRYELAAQRLVVKLELAKSNAMSLIELAQGTNHHPATHEAVAYLNRLGQLSYFFKSDWFCGQVSEPSIASAIPSILALLPIRHKLAAHRQIDVPRKGDSPNLGFNQFKLLNTVKGPIGNPQAARISYSFPTNEREKLLEIHRPTPIANVEYFGGSNHIVIFTPTQIHPTILAETFNLMELFLGYSR